MKFVIHSPAGVQAELADVDAVRAILVDGKPLTILPRHAPLMAEIGTEAITTSQSGLKESFRLQNGVLIVANDTIRVLTESMAEEEDSDV
jgi:F0F1-type ATP synthase epsilon subunit